MMKATRAIVFIACLVSAYLALAPQCAAQDGDLRLDLAAATVRPDSPVYVNLMLSNSLGAQVYTVRESIQFPVEKLVFSRAQLGVAADLAHAQLSLEFLDKSGAKIKNKEGAQQIDINITATQPLPDGPLIELQFRLAGATNERKDESIPLRHTAEALDEQGKKIAALQFSNAEVVVKQEPGEGPKPIMTCFFFSH
jgi:hypothetical protein